MEIPYSIGSVLYPGCYLAWHILLINRRNFYFLLNSFIRYTYMFDYCKALAVVDGCFFPKDKLNYSWMIPGVNYFSHLLVRNRKIIFL